MFEVKMIGGSGFMSQFENAIREDPHFYRPIDFSRYNIGDRRQRPSFRLPPFYFLPCQIFSIYCECFLYLNFSVDF